jgi:very-long-chain enoyl-CoA reductase
MYPGIKIKVVDAKGATVMNYLEPVLSSTTV